MAHRKRGTTRPCRIFLCYRRETAQTAITFKGIMDLDPEHEYGNIWYSNLEGVGNFILDVPNLIGEAEWVIFFVGKAFTAGFLDENEINADCVTAQELICIEKERQKREHEGRPFHLMTVNVDGGYFDRQCVKDIKQLFLVAGILRDDSVAAYKGINQNPYHSVSTLPHDFIEEHVAPYCALPVSSEEKLKPAPAPKKEAEPEGSGAAGEADAASVPERRKATQPAGTVSKAVAVPELVTVDADSATAREAAVSIPKSTSLTWLKNGNVLFGSYPQTKKGKRQPIEWLVLKREKDRALLISRYALNAKPYNVTFTDTTWAECSLRGWLNGRGTGDFPQKAFTAEERERILTTPVSADKNPRFSTNPGKPTKDKVFLLSIPEANKLFSSEEAQRCAPTDYAKSQGMYTNNDCKADGRPSCWWWLRSPGGNSNAAAYVYCGGSVNGLGFIVHYVSVGVRPALWINL